ncbi:glutathione-dependent formaldehyde dehydrogenase [Kocuria rhizophila]|uniref:zinc-dependent alcohol dehydrogenase n=1 Tax=Kocuria TaxID=57493 RepID=UPI0002FA1107|nr:MULTISPECIES: zinc-dependent alcohol dehydrogenase [Kocuria]MCG7424984.1 glutathione-dependent formaldehyde dehydrogenase [Kocuria rhizophila]MCR4526829.1 glutathione-dependent formaldehyde dehydrogenase [Kocuria rhizophila]MCT1457322.1 glutathione-dependent formaldehyde dehydrogenase [Kocuria rhizophila]MCT1546053.1 glutathione-dependent formaldehyde dehydrogenase [Kocuria rhizophila]MCT1880937.1 glutathione-dependent formaldehyde dehydrogenase [Kocuria rhizophila]
MRALTWQGLGDVRVENVPDPVLQDPTDAIVRVTSTAICGSDLHLYGVLGPYMHKNDVLGHEFMGIVEEVGSEVSSLKPGDRVVVPFVIACGHCWMCDRGLFAACETTQMREMGTGAALFGFSSLYGAVPGGQAEMVRVPHADFGPVKLPQDFDDERFLYLSDILPTAWQGVKYANVGEQDTLAVLGLGPVGQLAVRSAKLQGVQRVIAVDLVDERLATAKSWGVETVDLREVDDVSETLREMTDGRGPDGVLDAVGMEAHGNPVAEKIVAGAARLPKALGRKTIETVGIDRLDALHTAIHSVRRAGTVSLSGVYGGMADPMPMMEMFDKGITMRMGQCHVRHWTDELLEIASRPEDVLGLESLATHHVSLDDAPEAYKMFQEKKDGCLKVVLKP